MYVSRHASSDRRRSVRAARRQRREREPAVDDPVAGRCELRGRRVLPEAVPDHALVRENRGRIFEPDLALDERAHGVRVTAELEERLAAGRGRVAQHGIGRRRLQRREQVERRLRLAVADLQLREQNRNRLLLVAVRARARVVEPAARALRVAALDRQTRAFDEIVVASRPSDARRELRVKLRGGREIAALHGCAGARLEALGLAAAHRPRDRGPFETHAAIPAIKATRSAFLAAVGNALVDLRSIIPNTLGVYARHAGYPRQAVRRRHADRQPRRSDSASARSARGGRRDCSRGYPPHPGIAIANRRGSAAYCVSRA